MHKKISLHTVFIFLFLICPGFLLSNETAGEKLTIESGNEQAVSAYKKIKTIEIKAADAEGNPAPHTEIHLRTINAGIDFLLPETTIITDTAGIARITGLQAGSAGDYTLMAVLAENPEVYAYINLKINEESWVLHMLFGLFGGLGMFLFGMHCGSDGLQKFAGKSMKRILSTFTKNRALGVVSGIIITALTQSSSATTVMLVGFVNASLMTVGQTLSVIFGANIGTTITVQLIAFDISHFALLMIGAGFVLKSSKNKKMSYSGEICLGFGFIFFGMKVMSVSMAPLRNYPAFKEMLISLSEYPLSAILGSMLFTALIQSSGATIGLIVVFANQELISINSAIPLILGAHTGTSITGWIAAIGASPAAKKTALLNVVYNLIGTVVFLPFLYSGLKFGDFVVWCSEPFFKSPARQVAHAHMISAILKMLVMFPLYDRMIALVHVLIPETKEDEHARSVRTKYLSESLLKTPELALGNVAREIVRMAGHVEYMMEKVPDLLSHADEATVTEVNFREEKVDKAQFEITKYLSSLSEETLTKEQTDIMMRYMTIINELEGQADLINKIIIPFSMTKTKDQMRFSDEGYVELKSMFDRVNENFKLIINTLASQNIAQAERVFNSEKSFDILTKNLRVSHVRRVFDHKIQSIQTTTLHLDILQCFKRINLHSIEIAKAIIGDWVAYKQKNTVSAEVLGEIEAGEE